MPTILKPIKRGTTLRFRFDFTEEEWDAVYPFTVAKSEAKIKKTPSDATWTEYEFEVLADEETRSLTLRGVSCDHWPAGQYRLDLRLRKDDEFIFVPSDEFLLFTLIEPATDDDEHVDYGDEENIEE